MGLEYLIGLVVSLLILSVSALRPPLAGEILEVEQQWRENTFAAVRRPSEVLQTVRSQEKL